MKKLVNESLLEFSGELSDFQTHYPTVDQVDWMNDSDPDESPFRLVRDAVLCISNFAREKFYLIGADMDDMPDNLPEVVKSPNIEGSPTFFQVDQFEEGPAKYIVVSVVLYKQNSYYFTNEAGVKKL